jgi:hypothetical protein
MPNDKAQNVKTRGCLGNCVDKPPFGKGGIGGFKKKDATLLKEKRKVGRGIDI